MKHKNEENTLLNMVDGVSTCNGNVPGSGRCEKCGKPFLYVGDVPPGGFLDGSEPYCTCNSKKQTTGMLGWICPKCGAGISPFTNICPCCRPFHKWDITCNY